MNRHFIYARKSSESEDRQVLSIQSQIAELQHLARRHGVRVLEVLTEARSAKAPGRPVFNELMRRLYAGEAQGILCWKLDRLARNPVDGGAIIWAIKQHGIEILTPTQSFRQSDDTTVLTYIEFAMAQKYIDDLSRNVKRGRRTKVELGWYPGLPPLGYLNNPVKQPSVPAILSDPERFSLIRRAWDLMLNGLHTPPQILEIATTEWGLRTRLMNREGGKPLSRSGIYRLFTESFYTGRFEFPKGSGEWHQGKHEPMITEAEFDRVQTLLGRKGKPRRVTRHFAFSGLLRCGTCGSAVTAEQKDHLVCSRCRHKFSCRTNTVCPSCGLSVEAMRQPTLRTYVYYHCTRTKDRNCREPSIESRALEAQVLAYLHRIEIPEALLHWAISQVPTVVAEAQKAAENGRASSQRTLDLLRKRLDNLVKLKTSPLNSDGSLLSDEEYAHQRAELLAEQGQLPVTGEHVADGTDTEQVLQFAATSRRSFANGTPDQKRLILTAIGSNLTLTNRKLLFDARKHFTILESALNQSQPPRSPFEPSKHQAIERQFRKFISASPTGRSRSYTDRTSRKWRGVILKLYKTVVREHKREKPPTALEEACDALLGPRKTNGKWKLAA